MIDAMDWLIADGSSIKLTADGSVEGLLVVFGTPDQTDLVGDYFDATTDFGQHRTSLIWLNHAMPIKTPSGVIHIDDPIGEAELEITDAGVIVRGLLDAKYRYLAQIAPELGWSSGTAAHLVRRVTKTATATHIVRWPLGLDASITPTPAEPRTMIKSLTSLTRLSARATPALPQVLRVRVV